jgi:hypothetical protein
MLAEKFTMKRVIRLNRCFSYSLAAVIILLAAHSTTAQVLNIEDPTTPLDSLEKNDFKWGIGLSGNLSRQSIVVHDYGVIAEAVYHRNDQEADVE